MSIVTKFLQTLEYEANSSEITAKLPLLLELINNQFTLIKSCLDISCADAYFDLLETIQFIAARLLFVYHINLSPSLQKFVKDFDRIDDKDERQYFFDEIKNNRYHLEE